MARRSLRNTVFSFADRVRDHGYQPTLGSQGWARSVRAHEAQPAQGRSVAIRLPSHASSQRQKLQVRYGRKVFYGCSAWRRCARENNWLHETFDGIVARTSVVKELPMKTNIEDLNKMARKVLGTAGGCDRGSHFSRAQSDVTLKETDETLPVCSEIHVSHKGRTAAIWATRRRVCSVVHSVGANIPQRCHTPERVMNGWSEQSLKTTFSEEHWTLFRTDQISCH